MGLIRSSNKKWSEIAPKTRNVTNSHQKCSYDRKLRYFVNKTCVDVNKIFLRFACLKKILKTDQKVEEKAPKCS